VKRWTLGKSSITVTRLDGGDAEIPAHESRSTVPEGRSGMLRIKSPQDFGAAVVFIAIGLAGAYFGRDLQFGTASRMGPGYFPVILSWIIIALGVVVGGKALAIEGPRIEPVQLRPILVIILAILAFGYLIDQVGLAITAMLLTVLAGFARRDVNLVETVLLGAALAVFAVLVFVYGLSQPFPAWWGR
jgi:hypothetical protein